MNEQAYKEKTKCIDNAIEYHAEELKAWQRVKAEAETAQAEKPKLRNGNVYVSGTFVVVVRYYKSEWEAQHKDGSTTRGNEGSIFSHIEHFTFSHNIFDDLEELAKPLKEFEINGVKGYYDKHKWLCLDEDPDRISIVPKHIPAFILNLRRLIATAEKEHDGT